MENEQTGGRDSDGTGVLAALENAEQYPQYFCRLHRQEVDASSGWLG